MSIVPLEPALLGADGGMAAAAPRLQPSTAWSAVGYVGDQAPTDSGVDASAQIVTDGAGTWLAVWESNEDFGMLGTDFDILFARSRDNGLTWEGPAPLTLNSFIDVGDDKAPQLATDGAGHWVAVWESMENLGGIGTDWDILVARSSDNGQTWSAAEVLHPATATTDGSSADQNAELTTDGAGHWVAVWDSTNSLQGTIGTDDDIFIARSNDNGVTWSQPALLNNDAVSDGPGFNDRFPQVATDGTGHWVAVWNDVAQTVCARSQDNGQTWSDPTTLGYSTNSRPQVTTDGSGHWLVVWSSYDELGGTIGADDDILFSRSLDNGQSWSAAAVLNGTAYGDSYVADDFNPCVTTDGAGNFVALWDSTDDLAGTIGVDSDILASLSTDYGQTWSYPAPVKNSAFTDTAVDEFPRIATDGAGRWLAVWGSTDDLGLIIGPDPDILFSGHWSFSAPNVLNTNAWAWLDSGDDLAPQVASDEAGNWVTVWASADTLGATIGTDHDILVSRSTDNGQTWSAPAVLNDYAAIDSGGCQDESPQVTTDGKGNWVAVWTKIDSWFLPSDYDIMVSRSTDNGLSWSPAAYLHSNAAGDTGDDRYPQITTDTQGHWVVVWESTEPLGGLGTDSDILVSRSSNNGQTWTTPVALNDNAAIDMDRRDSEPHVLTDRAGHWLAAWSSNNGFLGGPIGTDSDIIISRSTDNGQTWSSPVALNSDAGSDSLYDWTPTFATDGAGNWVATWIATAGDVFWSGMDVELLVARSADHGQSWTSPKALPNYPASDSLADSRCQVTTDGAGNWIAVWEHGQYLGQSDVVYAYSTDLGDHWTSPAPLNSNATWVTTDIIVNQAPRLATDGAGHWVAVWSSNANPLGVLGYDLDIFFATAVTARPKGKDEVMLDFGVHGAWLWKNDATWEFVHAQNPVAMAGGDFDGNGQADVALSFAGGGTWIRYANGAWQFLHAATPPRMIAGDMNGDGRAELVAGFGGSSGTWQYTPATGAWRHLHHLTPAAMACGDVDGNGRADAAMAFGTSGLWLWKNDSAWQFLHSRSATVLEAGDVNGDGRAEVVAAFAPGGLWSWAQSGSWEFVHASTPTAVALGDVDADGREDVIASFGATGGVWEYNALAHAWKFLHSAAVLSTSAGDVDGNGRADVIVGFANNKGTWVYKNDSAWQLLHSKSAEAMVAAPMDATKGSAATSGTARASDPIKAALAHAYALGEPAGAADGLWRGEAGDAELEVLWLDLARRASGR